MNSVKNFIAIDLETTGLDYTSDVIIEVALAKFENGQVTDSLSVLVQPAVELRDFILKLTGLNREELSQAEVFSFYARKIVEFIGDSPLIAHNAQFDLHFLNKELQAAGEAKLNQDVYDSLLCSRIAWPHSPNHKLVTLVDFLELNQTSAHRALPDAIHAGEVFLRAQETFENFQPEVVSAMSAISEGTSLEKIFNETSAKERIDFKPFTHKENKSSQPSELSSNKVPSKEISLEDFFGTEETPGILSQDLSNFKFRKEQLFYAKNILKALKNNQFLCIEAETGIGKTLGYLGALAIWSQTSSERVVLSLGTRQQQNQIIQKTLPIIEKHFNLKTSVLKGRDNYLCLRKYAFYLNHRVDTLSITDREHFLTLIPWVAKTTTGDISENSGFNPLRNRILWSKLKGDGRSCQGPECEVDHECYSFQSRRVANQSQLIIVNHALFFKDLELDFSLLPSWDRIIFDEAHQLIKQGPHHLGSNLMFYSLRNQFQLIHNPYSEKTGLLHSLMKEAELLPQEAEICTTILEQMQNLERKFHKFLMKLGKQITKTKPRSDRFAFSEPLASTFSLTPDAVYTALEELIESSDQLSKYLSQDNHQAIEYAQGLHSFRLALEDFQSQLRHLVSGEEANTVYWIQDWHNPHKIQIHSAPGQLDKDLGAKLFPWLRTGIFTSATLTPNGNFDFFKNQIGLQSTPRTQEYSIKSHFKQDQITVKLMKGMHKGGSKEHSQDVVDWMASYIKENHESTLILYTSVAQLLQHQKVLSSQIENKLLLAQHLDGGIDNLLGMFKKQPGSILMGNQVFWEGLDCPGKELETIIIPKLPFPNPFEPRIAWMSKQIEENGGNPFQELHIPLALLELKQGMGRLIRSEDDLGTIIILDNRVVNSPYGRQFQNLWKSNHEILEFNSQN
tara:strand:+ start:2105 stop:4816 length:2712 start_codon:yes stop_codon:yes gene_type:complete